MRTTSIFLMHFKNLDKMLQNSNKSKLLIPSFFKFEFDNFTAGFLPELKALLQFRSCFEKKEVVTLFETDIPFISYEHLIEDKETNARPKDITDIEELKNTRKEKK